MVHICIVETTHCEYGQFHQDFDGGYQDCIATISREVYCDCIEEITFQEIRILKGYKYEEEREFEHVYGDVSSDEYEPGSRIIKDDYLLDTLNSLRTHYVYSEDLKLCNINVCSVQLAVEESYNKIKQFSLQKKEEENAIFLEAQIKHSTRLVEIEKEERDSYYAFFKNEILSGKLWCNRPSMFGEHFPIETAISNEDVEVFNYIIENTGDELFYKQNSLIDKMEYKHLSNQRTINCILSFTERHGDRDCYEFVCKELIRVINLCECEIKTRMEKILCVYNNKINYAKSTSDRDFYELVFKELTRNINLYEYDVKSRMDKLLRAYNNKIDYAKIIDDHYLKNVLEEFICLAKENAEFHNIDSLIIRMEDAYLVSRDFYLYYYENCKQLLSQSDVKESIETLRCILLFKKILFSLSPSDNYILKEALEETLQLDVDYRKIEYGFIENVVSTVIFMILSHNNSKINYFGRFVNGYSIVEGSSLLKKMSNVVTSKSLKFSFRDTVEPIFLTRMNEVVKSKDLKFSFSDDAERIILSWWIKDVNKRETFNLQNFGYSYNL